MQVDVCDDAVEAALAVARARGLYVILRIQERRERRLVVVDGVADRQRTSRLSGIGVHALTPDGSIGFASVDDLTPGAVRAAISHAGDLAEAARRVEGGRTTAPFGLASAGRVRVGLPTVGTAPIPLTEQIRLLAGAQEAVSDVHLGPDRTVRTALHAVDEWWRIARSDGTDVSFPTSRASLRLELSGRLAGTIARATANVSGLDPATVLCSESVERLTRRARRSAIDVRLAADAPAVASGSYRVVMRHALAKGLAHEAIGHLCESDIDGSVLMRRGKLRLGERLARESVSVVDGPLPGEYVQQPFSANGIERQTVMLVDRGILGSGLGDLFSAEAAGVPITGACRVASYRDRPTPRMSNIRVEVADAAHLNVEPDDLAPDDVVAALDRLGLMDRNQPTVYLTGYRGGSAHPRRGDFLFGVDAAFDLTQGGAPRAPASFSGLAERALASIVAGIGPLCTDAIGTCSKDGSGVSSSGGSHTLLVLDPDPDLIVSAAR